MRVRADRRPEKMCRMNRCTDLHLCVCFSHPERSGGAQLDGATSEVVGILGDDPLASRILGMLLEGSGYEARVLQEDALLASPSASLAGVDLVLFMPLLDEQRKNDLLDAM